VKVKTESDAIAFIDRMGFCLLFPQKDLPVASLWQAVKGPHPLAEWDEDASMIWGWKDDFPRRGLAWYGKLLRRKPCFVSRRALPRFLAAMGRPDWRRLYADGKLPAAARDVASWIEENGPTSAGSLRRRLGKARADKALTELQCALVLTHYGTEEASAGWPSAVLELVARAFPEAVDEARALDPAEARGDIEEWLGLHAPDLTPRDVSRILRAQMP